MEKTLLGAGWLLVVVGALAAGESGPTYDQIARSPSAYSQEVSLDFTMVYRGLRDPDPAFAAVGRNAATHVELVTASVRGARERLPIFVSKRSSSLVKKLRDAPTGVTRAFRGRIRYFKTPYYPPGPGEDRGKLVNVEVQQTIDLSTYFFSDVDRSSTGGSAEEPAPQGEVVHYLVDLYETRELEDEERKAALPEEDPEPGPAQGYREVRAFELARNLQSFQSIPIRLPITYRGRLAKILDPSKLGELVGPHRLPDQSCVRESDLEPAEGDPTEGLVVLELPGRLGENLAIAYGEDWDVASEFEGLQTGDRVLILGTLYPGQGEGSRALLVVEGID